MRGATIARVSTLILTQPEIRALLPMQKCMELVADALASLARGEGQNPLRRGMRLEDGRGLLGMMPGCTHSPATLGLKVVTVFPGNHGSEWDAHQGVVMLFDPEHGVPRAILDASEITAIRTAAASGVATRALARDDAGDLALLGAGVQARTHLEAMLAARPLRRVRVYSPRAESRAAFAARESERHGLRVEAMASARAAVEGADLVCTVTSSREPILFADWVKPGTHINLVGSSVLGPVEVDNALVAKARYVADYRPGALAQGAELAAARDAGLVDDSHVIAEIGEVLAGRVQAREDDSQITIYKSLGHVVQDLAAAAYLRERDQTAC